MKQRTVAAVAVGLVIAGQALAEKFDRITPSVHVLGAVGDSSAEHPESLAAGPHDPTRKDGSVQAIELGASLRLNDTVQGFANYALHYGADEEWEGELEEAFLKLASLPGGFELRGGRMLARFGAQNNVHAHGWDFVDTPLASGLLLGDGGLALDGGDLTWARRWRELTGGLTVGYGKVVTHDHGHDDEHGDDHDDHDDQDDAHEDHGDEHGGWEDDAAYARLFGLYQPTDFTRWTAGLSGAFGDNADHRQRSVYGLDLTYLWRERGHEAGGRALRWTTELLYKHEQHGNDDHDEHHDDEHNDGHYDEHDGAGDENAFGLYTQAVWSWNEYLDTGLRIGHVEGEGDRPDRLRISPAVTYRPLGTPLVHLRVQYNYDDLKTTEEHTVWAQLGISWGAGEVR